MDPSLKPIWDNFTEERGRDLYNRLKGWYRAVVVETNDPLRIGRVRFMMPEIHNSGLPTEEYPWAVPSFAIGGKRSGQWFSATIGDIIWITFEKQHLYGPIWVGGADPTRRKFYPLPSLSGKTPQAVNTKGEPADTPKDYDTAYHPKDNRPMSFGVQDRYGNADVFSAVGFFPAEHDAKPAEAGSDGITRKVFANASGDKPEANKPDVKYIARITKYGIYTIHNDVGYDWQKPKEGGGSKGEFEGNFDKDEKFEIERWKYFLKLLNEEQPEGFDQRRYEVRTRYGHKLEAREVGWEKTRAKEYDDGQRKIADSKGRDERWWKIRTKGGHFFQMIDTGNDPEQDLFVKRLLKSEVGTKTEQEDKLGRDQRMIRMQTRYGFKQVMDDRGSDSKDADNKETPRGNGWMVKGRRDNRGFCVGFNEKDESNAFFVYSPKGQGLEINDRLEYAALSTHMSAPLTEEREGHYGVEWPTNQMLGKEFEKNTYHVKVDKKNKYVRMKTAKRQGVEFRDRGSDTGCQKSWAEMRDEDDRGLWFNADGKYAIIRSKGSKQTLVLDDGDDYILIRNKKGKIQIIAEGGDIEIKTDENIKFEAKEIHMKAKTKVSMEAAGTKGILDSVGFGTDKKLQCQNMSGTHVAIDMPEHPKGPAPPDPKKGDVKKVEKPTDYSGPPSATGTQEGIEEEPQGDKPAKPDKEEQPPCDRPTAKEAEEAKKEWEDNAKKREEIADKRDAEAAAAAVALGAAQAALAAAQAGGGGGG